MATIDTKTFKYIIPESSTDSTAEQYEYYLVWQAPNGAFYNWLFTDFITKQKIDARIVNSVSENINKIYDKANNYTSITAEDITEDELEAIKTILRSKIIRRYYKDGSFVKLAINTDSFNKRKTGHRYNFQIEVKEIDSNILK